MNVLLTGVDKVSGITHVFGLVSLQHDYLCCITDSVVDVFYYDGTCDV